MAKKEDIELEIQQPEAEVPATDEEKLVEEEAAEMKEQAKKTIQMIKEKAKEEDPKPGSAICTHGCILYCLCSHPLSVPTGHDCHRQTGEAVARRQIQGTFKFKHFDRKMP